MIEDFLTELLKLYGFNPSDIVNIALERYFITEGYLTSETLEFLKNVSALDNKIIKEGLFEEKK